MAERLVAALAVVLGGAITLGAGCAHPLASAPGASAALEDRERYYDEHGPKTPVPSGSLFFASPLVLHDGERVEPGDLLAAVDNDSDTALAVSRYQAASAGFTALFVSGAALQLVSTASTLVGTPLLLKDPKAGLEILIGGRVVELVGFAAMATAYFVFKGPIVDAREAAFASYDADLRRRLGLGVSSTTSRE